MEQTFLKLWSQRHFLNKIKGTTDPNDGWGSFLSLHKINSFIDLARKSSDDPILLKKVLHSFIYLLTRQTLSCHRSRGQTLKKFSKTILLIGIRPLGDSRIRPHCDCFVFMIGHRNCLQKGFTCSFNNIIQHFLRYRLGTKAPHCPSLGHQFVEVNGPLKDFLHGSFDWLVWNVRGVFGNGRNQPIGVVFIVGIFFF